MIDVVRERDFSDTGIDSRDAGGRHGRGTVDRILGVDVIVEQRGPLSFETVSTPANYTSALCAPGFAEFDRV